MSLGSRFEHEHTIDGRVYCLVGRVVPARTGSYWVTPEPADVHVASITRDGVDATDEFNALADRAAWEAIEAEIIATDEEEYRNALENCD